MCVQFDGGKTGAPPPTFAGGSRKFSGSRVRVWGSEGRPGGFALDLRTRLGWFNGSCRQPRREESPGVWAGATARLSAARPGIEPVTSAERSRAPVPRLPVAQWRASRRASLFGAARRIGPHYLGPENLVSLNTADFVAYPARSEQKKMISRKMMMRNTTM